MGQAPIYRVTVTERTAKAISYQHRSGATKIDFRGTALMPKAHGEAKVESKKGYIEIEVEFRNMTEATQFGGEYLTYVLWAITPEGRTSNLGEILRGGGSAPVASWMSPPNCKCSAWSSRRNPTSRYPVRATSW